MSIKKKLSQNDCTSIIYVSGLCHSYILPTYTLFYTIFIVPKKQLHGQ